MRNDDPASVCAVADNPWLKFDARPYAEQAADYVRNRAKLFATLKPGSPERLLFVAMFPESFDTARALRPKDGAPPATHGEASDAVH